MLRFQWNFYIKLSKQYKDWAVICGYYNTGYPKINDYARFCVSHKDYQKIGLDIKKSIIFAEKLKMKKNIL